MEKMPYESYDVLICECHNTEHQMVVHYSEDTFENGQKSNMVYIHTHLNKRPFWERLRIGINYIFGHQSKYGMFDEFIINPSDADKLQDVIDYLRKVDKNI